MRNIYFTSDTHYGHSNIVRGTTNWKEELNEIGSHRMSSLRNFDTLEEHNQAIVDGINKTVGEDDILYHLGDWSFGGFINIWNFREQINCKNIHLILGNHDEHIVKNKSVDGKPNAQDLFSSVQSVLTVRSMGYSIFLSHYAHRVWDKSHKGYIHLYGHSHDSLEYIEYGKSMDVGVESAIRLFGEYRPFSIKEIINIMDKRDIKFPDHHNINTN